jgi:beta-galactosidase/beta-glucuronidase
MSRHRSRAGIVAWLTILALALDCAFLRRQASPVLAKSHLPLKTRWAADVSPERVLDEYPRPQLVRARWTNLNGLWQYEVGDSGGGAPARYTRTILVPFPIESELSGVERAVNEHQWLWYRRTFQAPARVPGERLLLHFGAVDWEATVIVNGRELGQHRGGYDPFTFDVTDALRGGPEQELVVRVWDPTDKGPQPRGKQVRAPRGIHFTAVTGIWQTVWLEPVPRVSLRALEVTPDVDAGLVRVHAVVANAAPDERVRVTVTDGARVVGSAVARPSDTLAVRIPGARLWSPADPFLYGLQVELASGDRVESYIGMRKIAVAKDSAGVNRLLLNGQPLFQLGLLDQGYWPDGLYTAPTDAALRFDIEEAKRLGFNLLRKHVKVEPDRWYYHADRLGMLVWQDMPSGSNDTPASHADFAAELEHIVDALRNHPAIVMWALFNEGWGQHDTKRYAAWLKAHDPSRLVDNASGWTDAGVGDVLDRHSYPDPTLPPLEPRRAAVLGEFGGLGLPVPRHLWRADHLMDYRRYDTPEALGAGYRALMRQVRDLERKGLAAAVYTQLTDVEGEVDGLLTYDRALEKLPPDPVQANRAGNRPAAPPSVAAGADR